VTRPRGLAHLTVEWSANSGEYAVTTSPEPGIGTLVEEIEKTADDYRYDEGDQEKFSHYAPKDKIMQAMIEGTPVQALCGKVWVPSRDPKRFPVCPECKQIYDEVLRDQ
jgi:hypothetical protein